MLQHLLLHALLLLAELRGRLPLLQVLAASCIWQLLELVHALLNGLLVLCVL